MELQQYERKHRAFLAEAQLRYPWQFRTAKGGPADTEVTVGPGWYGLLRQLFADVDRLVAEPGRSQFWWRCIRQVDGGLSISHQGGDTDVRSVVAGISHRAVSICEACGEAGIPRQADGWFATECDLHYIERLSRRVFGESMLARAWMTTPIGELQGLSPRTALRTGEGRDWVFERALRMALPEATQLTLRQRRWLAGLWDPLHGLFGDRLHDARIAELGRGPRFGGTLFAIIDDPVVADEAPLLKELLQSVGYPGLTPYLFSPRDLLKPADAPDPWYAMLAREGAVSLAPVARL